MHASNPSTQAALDELRSQQAAVEGQIRRLASSSPLASNTAAELERLQILQNRIHECIGIMSSTSHSDSGSARQNIFEDITLADNSQNFTVSTVGDLVTARHINLTGRSYNLAGQITDESFQKAVEAFARSGMQPAQDSGSASFHSRHGPGVSMMQGSQGASAGRS